MWSVPSFGFRQRGAKKHPLSSPPLRVAGQSLTEEMFDISL
jgi:hypothetical protein